MHDQDAARQADDHALIRIATAYAGPIRDAALLLAAARVRGVREDVIAIRGELLKHIGEHFS